MRHEQRTLNVIFSLERGWRQGNPLSVSFHNLHRSSIYRSARKNGLNGIKIDERELDLSTFADDADFLVFQCEIIKTNL